MIDRLRRRGRRPAARIAAAGELAERVRDAALALYRFGPASRPGRGSSWPTRSSSSG